MAKKNKVVIVDQELVPTTLAKLENKKVNILGLIIILGIFGAVIFYLPDISNYVEKILKPQAGNPVVNNPNQTNPDSDLDEEEIKVKEYKYVNGLAIDEKDFTLTNFMIVNNVLSLDVKNKNNIALNLDDYNYYLGVYNAENTLLQRIKFDDILVSSNSSTSVSFTLNDVNVDYFTFIEIGVDEYPAYSPVANEEGEATLVCRKDNRTINYLLKDNKLYSIEDLIEARTTDADFANLYTTYQSRATTYNNLAGVNSSVSLENGLLKFNTYINLNALNTVNINDITYPKDTDAKVMNFELDSKGYTCK